MITKQSDSSEMIYNQVIHLKRFHAFIFDQLLGAGSLFTRTENLSLQHFSLDFEIIWFLIVQILDFFFFFHSTIFDCASQTPLHFRLIFSHRLFLWHHTNRNTASVSGSGAFTLFIFSDFQFDALIIHNRNFHAFCLKIKKFCVLRTVNSVEIWPKLEKEREREMEGKWVKRNFKEKSNVVIEKEYSLWSISIKNFKWSLFMNA